MADFKPKTQKAQAPDPIRYAGGPTNPGGIADKGRAAQARGQAAMYKGQALGNIYKGLGAGIEGAVNTADKFIQDTIGENIDDSVTNINNNIQNLLENNETPDPLIATPPSEEGLSFDSKLPPEAVQAFNSDPTVKNVTTEAEALQQGYNSGQITQTQYLGKLDSLRRQLESKYPSYRNEIRGKFRSITGVEPEQAYTLALIRDAEAEEAARQTAADKAYDNKRTFINSNLGVLDEVLGNVDWYALPLERLQKEVSQYEGYRTRMETRSKEIDLAIAEQNLTVEAATDAARGSVNDYVRMSQNAEVNSFTGGDPKNLQTVINELQMAAAKGDRPSPEEQAELEQQYALAIQQKELSLRQMLSDPRYDLVSTDDKEKMIESGLAELNLLGESIFNENYGLAGVTARAIEAQKNDDYIRMMGDGTLRRFKALQDSFGGETMALLLANAQHSGMDQYSQISSAIFDYATGVAASDPSAVGPAEAGTMPEILDRATKMIGAGKGVGKGVLREITDKFSNTELPAEMRNRLGTFLYSDSGKTVEMFKTRDRSKVFNLLYNAETAQVALDMPEMRQGDGEIKPFRAVYMENMTSVFFSQTKELIDSLSSINPDFKDSLVVTFDPDRYQFEVAINPEFNITAERAYGLEFMQQVQTEDWKELNRYVKGFTEAYAVMSGGEFKEEALQRYFQSLGIPFTVEEGPEDTPEGESPRQSSMEDGPKGNLDILQFSGMEVPDDIRSLLTFIGAAEVEGGYGYNTVFGGGQEAITDMSINELLESMKARTDGGSSSSASGAYQFTRGTLRTLVQELGLTGDEIMTAQMQDYLGMQLLKRRGLEKFQSGEMTADEYGDALSNEWAALPDKDGKSPLAKYHPGNKPRVGRNSLMAQLEALQKKLQ